MKRVDRSVQNDTKLKQGMGFLFKATRKYNEHSPDYIGALKLPRWLFPGGKRLRIIGWVREWKNGRKILAITIQRRTHKPSEKQWEAVKLSKATQKAHKAGRKARRKARKALLKAIDERERKKFEAMEKALRPPVEVYRKDTMR